MLTIRSLAPCSRALTKQVVFALRTTQAQDAVCISRYSQWASKLPKPAQPLFQQLQMQHRTFASDTSTSSATVNKSEQQRIYYGTLASRMKAVKLFSISTSIMGLVAQPVLLEQGMKLGGTGMAVFICTFAGFFTFVTPMLLHFVTKKYVTEIHYNPKTEEYTATTISLLLRKIETKFRPSDVKVPDVPGMFTSFLVGKRALFVDPSLFDDPEHYVRIMGYDKPIDFKLDLKASAPADEQKNSKT